MHTDLVPQAVGVATRLRKAHQLRAFEHAASEFVRLLGTIPDCAADEVSNTDLMAVQRLAEGVIDQIETRLAAGQAPAARQQLLAGTVYEISRLLEEVHTWRRHYHMRRAR